MRFCTKFYTEYFRMRHYFILSILGCTIMPGFRKSGHVLLWFSSDSLAYSAFVLQGSVMHSLLTPLVHTFCMRQLHLHQTFGIAGNSILPQRCRLMNKRFKELMFINSDITINDITINVHTPPVCYGWTGMYLTIQSQ